MVRIIILSSGRECLIDGDDFEKFGDTPWSDDGRGYAIRASYTPEGMRTTEKMHRLILGAEEGEIVDHINGNTSDNRKENLRIVSQLENARNTRVYNTNKTGYRGVALNASGSKNRYTAQITVNYRKIHLGMFDCVREAALAYNEAAIKYFGEFARLNEIDVNVS